MLCIQPSQLGSNHIAFRLQKLVLCCVEIEAAANTLFVSPFDAFQDACGRSRCSSALFNANSASKNAALAPSNSPRCRLELGQS